MLKPHATFPIATLILATSATAFAATSSRQSAAIVEHVTVFLQEQAASFPGAMHLTVDTSRIDNLPECKEPQAFLPGGQRLHSQMSVGIRCLAPQAWTGYVQVNAAIKGTYYVPAHTLKAGTAISRADLNALEGDLLRLSPGVVLDPDLLIGRITTQRIRSGSPIKATTLRHPESIQRGQLVRLEARGAGFVATSEGEAMQAGAPGTQIRVRTESGRIVSGTILGANTVAVTM